MSWTDWVAKKLEEYPAIAVAKQQLDFMAEKLKTAEADKASLEKRVAELEERVTELKELNAELRGKIVAFAKASSYEDHEGVLWKREADGSVKPIAYCPDCQRAMHSVGFHRVNEVKCSKCGLVAPFQPYRVEKIAAELSKKRQPSR
jgi:hypothetical protein